MSTTPVKATATIFALTPAGPITCAFITIEAVDLETAGKMLEKVCRNVTAHTLGEEVDAEWDEGPYRCSGSDSHLPACGGTCGRLP